MLTLNAPAPEFTLEGIKGSETRRHSLGEYRGRWVVLFFYPADFTFVCPTEILGFQKRLSEFQAKDAEILAVSVDDLASHRAWADELGGIGFPLLSDPGGETARIYGVLNDEDGRAFRATVIVSPDGTVAYLVVSPMNAGRSVDETLRVVSALQTGRLCPADWRPGQPTFEADSRY